MTNWATSVTISWKLILQLMTSPTEINSVFWNEEKKSWDHKLIKVEEYHGFIECQQCRKIMAHNIKTDGEFKVVYVECDCSRR